MKRSEYQEEFMTMDRIEREIQEEKARINALNNESVQLKNEIYDYEKL